MKNFLILLFLLSVISAVAQPTGGIRGRVVERTTRQALGGVRVSLSPTATRIVTDAEGYFMFESLARGTYTLRFEATDFETLTLVERVDKLVRTLDVVLVPDTTQPLDDAVFAEFDSETLDDTPAMPSSLSASKDLFNNIASYKFSEMRFNVRGYDSQYSDVYLDGIRFNDALTGYTPWSLWSGLNDVTRNQTVAQGISMGDVGLGGIGGVTNIDTRPSLMRKGLRLSLVNGNAMYRFRAMATYASGAQDNGWSYAFSLSTRQGGNSYVRGVYYNAFGYFMAIEKAFAGRHKLSLTLFGAPTQRGAQQAATQEAYDLVGNNYYNPNWGWQGDKRRNARVRSNHEPVALLSYTFEINDRSQLDLAAAFRFGHNGYSALTWQDGPDPRPDYYRYLPSYYLQKGDPNKAAWAYENWRSNSDNTRHFDWDGMYDVNYRGDENPIYGLGHRSNYIVEERRTDQRDWNMAAQFAHLFRDGSRLTGGINLRRNRTEYYTRVKDLMGGAYWIDVDKFAERDFSDDAMAYQNNMDYYEKYGHAQAARKGDKFGYDYYANLIESRIWGSYGMRFYGLGINLAAEAGYASLWRDGRWRKGLFPDNSKGRSDVQRYFVGKVKANFDYRFSAAHALETNLIFMQDAPTFQSAFISPRTRNQATPGVGPEQVFSTDLTYNLRLGDLRARLSVYYTGIYNQTKVISYYDDVAKTFTNFAMSGMDKRHFGMEAAVSIPIYNGLFFNSAISWGQYTYNSNPNYTQLQDNSGKVVSEGAVYWKDFRVESTPQTALNLGLSYRSRNNIFLSLDANYYNNMYLSMSPIYRTDAVLTPGMTAADIHKIRHQEEFNSAWVLSASVGKNWYIHRQYTLGFSLEVKNLLNNQHIKSGGYEQTRLSKNTDTAVTSYQPFDSKYFYMFGTTYYLNIYFRF